MTRGRPAACALAWFLFYLIYIRAWMTINRLSRPRRWRWLVMRKLAPAVVAAGCVAASFLAAAPSQASRASGPAATPRWILHIQRYPGGISNGVRAMVSAEAMAARSAAHKGSIAGSSASFGPNVQMNNDSNPPLPQNETAVAVSLANPE